MIVNSSTAHRSSAPPRRMSQPGPDGWAHPQLLRAQPVLDSGALPSPLRSSSLGGVSPASPGGAAGSAALFGRPWQSWERQGLPGPQDQLYSSLSSDRPVPALHAGQTTPSPIHFPPPPIPPQPFSAVARPSAMPPPEFSTLLPPEPPANDERSSEDYPEVVYRSSRAREEAATSASSLHYRRPRKRASPHRKRPPMDADPNDERQVTAATATSSPRSLSPIDVSRANALAPRSPASTPAATPTRSGSQSMSITNLLSGQPPTATPTRAAAGSFRPSPRPPMSREPTAYRLTVRQQPIGARACGFGERDRRVIDPPPILQLSIEDPSLSAHEIRRRLRHPFLVVHCSIFDETGTYDVSAMSEETRAQKRLMGTLVASPFVGVDEDQREATFFCFTDLSCRTAGVYRLNFVFLVIDPLASLRDARTPILAEAMSEPFTVVSPKEFRGMRESSALAKCLKEQGCPISLKKGSDRQRGAGGRGRDSSAAPADDDDDGGGDDYDDNDDSDDMDGGSSSRQRKKSKKT